MVHPGHGVQNPVESTPPRAARSIRRTVTLDLRRPEGFGGPLEILADGRDLFTGDSEAVSPSATASFRALIEYTGDRPVLEVNANDEAPLDVSSLIGVPAMRGFRRNLQDTLPADKLHTLVGRMLDDVPMSTMIANHSQIVHTPGMRPPPQRIVEATDGCAGWRSGGHLVNDLNAGRSPLIIGPRARSLTSTDDPLAWHETRDPVVTMMRRHRRIDMTQDGANWIVCSFMRDSYWVAEGGELVERILHEYTVEAEIDRSSHEISEVSSTPTVLPWRECFPTQHTAKNLRLLPVQEVSPRIRSEFAGPSFCTHLNDTLRTLEGTPVLGDQLDMAIGADR